MKRFPFFLSMGNCPRRCIYCHQGKITGSWSIPSPEDVHLFASALDEPHEICFFGGSFTCFPFPLQEKYLRAAVSAPEGSTIRFSTHPECITPSILQFLTSYPISMLELGISSLDDHVLATCNRGYDGKTALSVLELIFAKGLHVCAQMMTGLPEQTEESSLEDLRRINAVRKGRPATLRIYPCLVLAETPLAKMYESGRYSPPSTSEAALHTGRLFLEAQKLGFAIQRIGLQESESLRHSVLAGPYHPAFGELARSAALVLSLIEEQSQGPWIVPAHRISLLRGHGEYGFRLLADRTGLSLWKTKKNVVFSQ